jgi:uncharacterized BrkB/YihY/UPF0761 family membrane protein
MDIVKAPNLKDALLLGLVFAASFFLANTLNQTAVIIFQEKFSSENKVKDWIIYTFVVIIIYILFFILIRKLYSKK